MKLFILGALVALSVSSFAAKPEMAARALTATRVDTSMLYPATAPVATVKKLNFFQCLKYSCALKKMKSGYLSKADNQAWNAFSFGIIAMSLFLVGLFIHYLLLATIPAAIVAILLGEQALKNNTAVNAEAHMGKTLGLISLVGLAGIVTLGAIVLAAITN